MLPYNSLTYYDEFSFEKNADIREFLDNTFITALLEKIKKQCVIVLGGDGTMLRAIGEHANKEIPFLGINFGHKGFLLNHQNWVFPDIPSLEERLYPLLQVKNNDKVIGTAFNDVNIYSPEGKAISLNISNGFGKLELWGDGMILATPAGSTGHSKSYGGPILPHKSENLVITPKGNISPQSPKAIEDEHCIKIKNSGRRYPIAVNIDGTHLYVSQHDEKLSLEIEKLQKKVTLLIAQNHLQDWDNKVMQEQGFRV